MAVVTPDTTKVENFGSLRLVIADFTSDIDDGDTWNTGTEGTVTDPSSGVYYTGIGSIVGYWANGTDDPSTQTSGGIDLAESNGTITFNLGEDDRNFTVYLLVKG
jgi:hypothetical protein